MPQLRRHKLPRALMEHLAERMLQREISVDQIGLLAEWCDTFPEVPAGTWFKRFSGMIACGEGELVKTFLVPGQAPHGEEIF